MSNARNPNTNGLLYVIYFVSRITKSGKEERSSGTSRHFRTNRMRWWMIIMFLSSYAFSIDIDTYLSHDHIFSRPTLFHYFCVAISNYASEYRVSRLSFFNLVRRRIYRRNVRKRLLLKQREKKKGLSFPDFSVRINLEKNFEEEWLNTIYLRPYYLCCSGSKIRINSDAPLSVSKSNPIQNLYRV